MNAFIKAGFWTAPEYDDMTPDVRLAALWMMTNPARDAAGFTKVGKRRFVFETGLDFDVLEKLFTYPQFEKIDDSTFWAVGFVQHQVGRGAAAVKNNMAKGCIRALQGLPRACKARFYAEYPEFEELDQSKKVDQKHKPSEGVGKDRVGKGKVSIDNSNNCTGGDEQTVIEEDPRIEPAKNRIDALTEAWVDDGTEWSLHGTQQILFASLPQLDKLQPEDWRILRWHYVRATKDPKIKVSFSRQRFLEALTANLARARSDWSAAGEPSLRSVKKAESRLTQAAVSTKGGAAA